MTPKVPDYLAIIDGLSLSHGGHGSRAGGTCVMEAAAWIAARDHSDAPPCVCPVIRAFLMNWNDNLPDNATRDRLLKPLLPLILDTKSTPEIEQIRSFMALDWFIREHVPAWFDLTPSLKPHGDALREASRIVDLDTAKAAGKITAAASAAARAAAWAAASAAAWAAARAAARDAAGAAARDAAGAAAWAAAGAAAWAAARDAARDAARAAARDAARGVLEPTTERLQASAQDLVRRMCEVQP